MSRPQKTLIVGGLLVVLLGLVYGMVYNFVVEHKTLPRLREQHRSVFVAAAEGNEEQVRNAFQHAKSANYRYVRAIDVHTHLIKMASVAILLGLVFSVVRWDEKQRFALAVLFLASAVVFPLGVFAEIFSTSVIPQGVAAGGALLAIASLAFILWGLVGGPPKESSPTASTDT